MKLTAKQFRRLITELAATTPTPDNTGYVTYDYESPTLSVVLTFRDNRWEFNENSIKGLTMSGPIDNKILAALDSRLAWLEPDIKFVEDEEINPGSPMPVDQYYDQTKV